MSVERNQGAKKKRNPLVMKKKKKKKKKCVYVCTHRLVCVQIVYLFDVDTSVWVLSKCMLSQCTLSHIC